MEYNDAMKIEVHMSAFGKKSDIRTVDIPAQFINEHSNQDDILELVFRYGQNNFQPQQMRSVSVGDVIRHQGKYFMVAAFGFKKITPKKFCGLPDNVSSDMKYFKMLHGV